ncbi:DUF3231 family protein [Paenibacillus nanensis]|uniref:DUF3231 family protein n=1 Tax=Paenibacillus nanensis TaxID=393251 RepID=A0A3A1UUC1_9BACL|nr:DUF3231 family protein [Paenibacillus nanensis]RIX52138.1 DUF3231 family protein [Paenibacillus nanensis]
MGSIHPMKLQSNDTGEKLNAAEQGKLWATYMGNTMSIQVLSYVLNHVEDKEVKEVMQSAFNLSKQIVMTIKDLLQQEQYPLPIGFTEEDVNVSAPRLFADEFYLHYLKYLGKAGSSLYSIAVPLVTRRDVRSLFTQLVDNSVQLLNKTNEVLISKGMLSKPPYIPYPTKAGFIDNKNYMRGFFGEVRPLQAMEITHLYDIIENNSISKAVLIGFSQVAQSDKVKQYFLRGKDIAYKHYNMCSKLLEQEDLSAPMTLDPLVTTSTTPPFSDKLMMFHKVDMFTMRVRSYANAASLSARHDLLEKYTRMIVDVGKYSEDGANLMIQNRWLEEPPHCVDREALVTK